MAQKWACGNIAIFDFNGRELTPRDTTASCINTSSRKHLKVSVSISHVFCSFEKQIRTMGVMERSLTNAVWALGGGFKSLSQPWETGPQEQVFKRRLQADDCQIFKKPFLGRPVPTFIEEETKDLSAGEALQFIKHGAPLFASCVKAHAERTFEEDRQHKSLLALRKWRLILSHNFSATSIGREIQNELELGADDDYIDTMLIDVFGVKSPNTLLKRASSVLKYLTWFAENFDGVALPLRERTVYEYIRFLESSGSAPTAATSFRESLNFCKHIMGLESASEILESRRISGAAQRLFAGKRPLNQAPVLKVATVAYLEKICATASELMDVYMAGVLLICVYGRCRWSDIAHLQACDLSDDAFIEMTTTTHKTSITEVRKTTLLPIAVPTVGITEYSWYSHWSEAASILRVDLEKVPLGALMCAPKNASEFTKRPLTSSEASKWMKGLLKDVEQGSDIRSHSLKCTVLSWCAKAGLSPDVREVLGRHSSGTKSSAAVYSRDLQAGPLRKLVTLLKKIRLKIFDPDASRSGRWTSAPVDECGSRLGYRPEDVDSERSHWTRSPISDDAAELSLKSWDLPPELNDVFASPTASVVPTEVGVETKDPNLDPCSSASEEELESDSESEDEAGDENLEEIAQLVAGPTERPLVYPEGAKCFFNKRNNVVHCLNKHRHGKFICGVACSENYEPTAEESVFRFPTCGRCFTDVGRAR